MAGSAEEVTEVGLNPKMVVTCGPDRPGVRACPLYEVCDRPQKDVGGFVKWTKDGQEIKPLGPSFQNLEGAVREGPGPLNLGIRRTKIIGGTKFRVVNATCACWEYPYQRAKHLAANEGGKKPVALIQVIAIEGETINLPGSKPVLQDDGKIIHAVQKAGIPTVIAPFVRPRDSEDFAASTFATAEINREAKAERGTQLKDFVKIKPGALQDVDLEIGGTDTDAGPTRGGSSSRG